MTTRVTPSRTNGDRFLILTYHRITRSADDFLPTALNCPVSRFQEHLSALSRCTLLQLRQAWHALLRGDLPPRSVVLTFDDCWSENIETVARPLSRMGAPATFFICSDDIDRDTLNPNHHFYYLFSAVGAAKFGMAVSALLPNVPQIADASVSPYKVRRHVEAALGCPFSSEIGRRFLADLAEVLQIESPPQIAAHLYLRSEQVRQLPEFGIEVGNHTFSHQNLPDLNEAVQREELARAQQQLSALTGEAVETLAYPFGRYNDISIKVAAETGHVCACTITRGHNDRDTDPFRLHRIDISQMSGNELAAVLTANSLTA